jgi:hypothetical protein
VPKPAAGGLLERPEVCLVLRFELHLQDQIQACPTRVSYGDRCHASTEAGRRDGGVRKVGQRVVLRHAAPCKLTQRSEIAVVKKAALAAPSIDYYVSSIAVANSNGMLLDLDLGVPLLSGQTSAQSPKLGACRSS